MKLYIKQRVFSWRDRFTVWDENGDDRFYVEGQLFSWGKKLHVYGADGKEAAFIQQKVFSFRPRFFVFVDGRETAEIVKQITLLRPRYSIEGLGWDINGSFMAHDYQITRSDRAVVTIHKKWMTWADCYELDIADPRDEIPALAVVLAIDCVMDAAAATAAST